MMRERKEQVLSFIAEYTEQYNISPSFADICYACNIPSKATVYDILHTLKDDGRIDFLEGRPRTLRITEKVEAGEVINDNDRYWPTIDGYLALEAARKLGDV